MKTDDSVANFNENAMPLLRQDGVDFLIDYIRQNACKSLLEVGTALASTSITLARTFPKLQIDTLEREPDVFKQAKENILEAGLETQIHSYLVDAITFETQNKYDLIFIDGAKAQYAKHMQHFEANLRDKGAFVFDNINFYGWVDSDIPAQSKNVRALVRKLRKFREDILANEKYNATYLPDIGDGMILAVKK